MMLPSKTPVAKLITLHIFDSDNIGENIVFSATNKTVRSAIGDYKLTSVGGGYYNLAMVGVNPQAFRAQVATMAAYNNQLHVNNVLFDHVYLDSEEYSAFGTNKNKYAALSPQFGPYQYSRNDGGLWYKSYVAFERLSMSQGLNVGNNAYGSIAGADFPVKQLKEGWKFLPTAYISYNGGHQTFDGVSMYQNGGQAGFMGTFMKGDFISSILAYAGGYGNEMQVSGTTDKTGNWFAGTAVKSAYNFHPARNLIIQPTLLASYNAFGKQDFYSNFGQVNMNAGMLNGINVAPGLNLIYGRETWNVYLTTQYMYYINDKIGGKADSLNLGDIKMNHGYIEYGIGATKTWKERLSAHLQVTLRNGGRTGVGLQTGASFRF